MSVSIDNAFVRQFESSVHVEFQRMGTKLRNTIRRQVQVNGEDVRFQKYGKGTAGTKSRHGDVPLMNVSHTNVDCTMEDYYAADYVDNLDMLKTNIDERTLCAQAGSAALGRKTDELIVTAMSGTTNTVAASAAGLNKTKIESVFVSMGNDDVPDDGNRYWAVSHKQWTDLLTISEFANADYVGQDDLPYKNGMTAKRWMGFLFFTFSGLTKSGSDRQTYAYHTLSMGHGIGQDVKSDWTWEGRKQAHLVVNSMSQGSCLIDETACYRVDCQE